MSIEFKCRRCRHAMEVNDEMVGRSGKCPECGSIITVPEQSENNLIFVEDGFFQSSHLNKLFDDFLKKYADRILNSKVENISDGDMLHMEIYTGDGRSQIVLLGHVKKADIIFAKSTIGIPVGENSGLAAFDIMTLAGTLSIYPTYGFNIVKNRDGDFVYKLCRANRSKHVDEQTFYDLTIRLAEVADDIERQVFGSDYR